VVPQNPAAAGILKETLSHLRKMPEMREDVAKLETCCCSPSTGHPPRQAPQPLILPTFPQQDLS
jgi:hypothetical protein